MPLPSISEFGCCMKESKEVIVEYFRSAQKIAHGERKLRSHLMDIATPGVQSKTKPFLFATMDECGDRTIRRYAEHALIVIKLVCILAVSPVRYGSFKLSHSNFKAVMKLIGVSEIKQEL